MSTVLQSRYWPYDEVTAVGDCSSGRFVFSTPWVNAEIEVDQKDVPRIDSLLNKLNTGNLSFSDLADVTWLFSSLSEYSLAYLLPRSDFSGKDQHILVDKTLIELSPHEMLLALSRQTDSIAQKSFTCLAFQPQLPSEWKWDIAAALSFSAVSTGYDPISLFSIARRFHLLESVENNKTGELFQFISGLKSNVDRFREASARVVRQNHYVTQKCHSVLKPGLQIAGNSKDQVQRFIEAEAGHDVFLKRAMKDLGIQDFETIEVIDPTVALMEAFKIAAQRNFLAFSMVVDMFERSSYRDQDPLASLLSQGGYASAANQIDHHREINDSGGHENVGISFLKNSSVVDLEYATEALRLAELITFLLHRISSTLLEKLSA